MHTEPINEQQLGAANRSIYAGRRIALLTQHGKQAVLAPVLQRALACHVEWDDERELEVVAMAQGHAAFAHLLATEWDAVAEFAGRLPFPAHSLVVRPDGEAGSPVRKGIDSWFGLEAAFHWALARSANGFVFVETDVRAHVNPTRMATIGRAAEDLARRLASLCPVCATPGFAVLDIVGGLPCSDCGAPTSETRAEVLACLKCVHRVTRPRLDAVAADPGRCGYCNP